MKVVVPSLLAAAASSLAFWIGVETTALGKVAIAALIFGGWVGIFVLIFLVSVMATPHRLAEEAERKWNERFEALEAEIATIKAETQERKSALENAQALEEVVNRGYALLQSRSSAEARQWRQDVIQWFSAAEEMVNRLIPHEAFLFRTITPRPEPKSRFDDCAEYLAARINKLRLITGRAFAGSVAKPAEKS